MREEMKIKKVGTVTITGEWVTVEGFEFQNATCRDGAIMAAAWAIGKLQEEMLKTIQKAGGGNICIG